MRSAVTRARPRPDGGEGDLAGEAAGPGVAGQDGAGLRVELGRRPAAGRSRGRSRAPIRRRTSPTAAGAGRRCCARVRRTSLTGSSGGTSTSSSCSSPCSACVEARVALAVADGRWPRRRRAAGASASRPRRSPRRAGRPPRRAGRRPGRCARASGGSSGCCPPRCSPGRPRSPGSRSPGWRARWSTGPAAGPATGGVPSMTITYSRPSGVNPPRPFQNEQALGRRGGPAAASVAIGRGGRGQRRREAPRPVGRSSCSASDPRPPPRTARAAAASSTASSAESLVRGQDEDARPACRAAGRRRRPAARP